MYRLLKVAAVGEAVTGLVMLVYPAIVIRLLFGQQIAGAGVIMSRIAGMSLIALSIACWPSAETARAFFGMLTYSVLVTLYLVYVGGDGGAGILLWLAVAVHATLSALLLRAKIVGHVS